MNTKASMKRYHEWVATLPCVNCGIEGYTQVAHYQGLRGPSFGRGTGKKAHDLMVAPLCCARPDERGCHAQFDDNEVTRFADESDDPLMRKIDRSELFLFWVADTLILGQAVGRIATI